MQEENSSFLGFFSSEDELWLRRILHVEPYYVLALVALGLTGNCLTCAILLKKNKSVSKISTPKILRTIETKIFNKFLP
jgi:hypothetical protein